MIFARGLPSVPAVFLAAGLIWSAAAAAQIVGVPLVLETKIPLGQVSGRIDHLGVDVKRQRLFVAELGNNSLGVVDLAAGKVLRTIAGLSEPQGVAYVPNADNVFVANAGDGSVRVLRGDDFAPIGQIELGEDADNVRVDTRRNRVLVGYGNGALAVIDPATRTKAADIRLKGHPEGFQIDETGTRVFVNVPDARDIEIADLASEANRSLPMHGAGSNFPMAIDGDGHRVLVVFRSPPTLMALSSQDGRDCREDRDLQRRRRRVRRSPTSPRLCELRRRGHRCPRTARRRVSAAGACADGIRSAHLALRSRARPPVCRSPGKIE